MNSVAIGVDVLVNDSLVQEAQDTLKLMKESVSYMNETLTDILDIQKVDEGLIVLNYTSFMIDDLLESVLKRHIETIKDKSLSLNLDISIDVPLKVIGDYEKIHHLLNNIIFSSLKFCPSKSEFKVVLSFIDGCVEFKIYDQGTIIAPDIIKNFFVPYGNLGFKQLKSYRGPEVGHLVSKAIANLHGGLIFVESSAKESINLTEFRICIPFEIVNDTKPESLNRSSKLLKALTGTDSNYHYSEENIKITESKPDPQVSFIEEDLSKPIIPNSSKENMLQIDKTEITQKYQFKHEVLIVDGEYIFLLMSLVFLCYRPIITIYFSFFFIFRCFIQS